MFQCYSLNSSHHLLPSLCPQVRSLSASPLLPCKKFHRYHLSKFHICAFSIQYFPFWLILLSKIGSRFIHLTRTESNVLLFMDLDSLEEYWSDMLKNIYSHGSSGLWVFGRKTTEERAIFITSYRGQTLSTWLTTVDAEFELRCFFFFTKANGKAELPFIDQEEYKWSDFRNIKNFN